MNRDTNTLFKSKMPISWKPLKNRGIYTFPLLVLTTKAVGYPLKNRGIYTLRICNEGTPPLDIHLKIEVFTPEVGLNTKNQPLDIHLKIEVFTPCKSEYNELQPFIEKISDFFECSNIE